MKHHKLNEIPEEPVTHLFSRRFFTDDKITMAFLTAKEGCVVPRHQHDSEQNARNRRRKPARLFA